jgi:hypothetical protein
VDHSISSTVNLSEYQTEVISRIYLQAWKGIKGITVYRDETGIPFWWTGKHTRSGFKNRKFALRLPQTEAESEKIRVYEVAGDEVIRMPDGG